MSTFDKEATNWLQQCYDRARDRIPAEILDTIPNDVWTLYPLGRNIVLRRFPATSKYGQIVVPDAAQGATNAGWVLVVSPEISTPGPNVPHVFRSDPLDLVGLAVVVHKMRGTTLKLSFQQREFSGDYLHLHISDVMSVMTYVDEDQWKPEKKFR
jgi:hypothetical protein